MIFSTLFTFRAQATPVVKTVGNGFGSIAEPETAKTEETPCMCPETCWILGIRLRHCCWCGRSSTCSSSWSWTRSARSPSSWLLASSWKHASAFISQTFSPLGCQGVPTQYRSQCRSYRFWVAFGVFWCHYTMSISTTIKHQLGPTVLRLWAFVLLRRVAAAFGEDFVKTKLSALVAQTDIKNCQLVTVQLDEVQSESTQTHPFRVHSWQKHTWHLVRHCRVEVLRSIFWMPMPAPSLGDDWSCIPGDVGSEA